MATNDFSNLQALAIGLEGARLATRESADIWSRLIRHQLEIVQTFATERREYMILRERVGGPAPLSGRNLAIVEKVLVGVGRKVLSHDLGLASSTIAQILRSALSDMGLDCSPARAPSLLVKLAHEARGLATTATLMAAELIGPTMRYWVLSDEIESPLLRKLSPAERAVLSQLLCGRSYADIAARRRTSYRTVANQVASGCQRLGVSGRFDLLKRVAAFQHE